MEEEIGGESSFICNNLFSKQIWNKYGKLFGLNGVLVTNFTAYYSRMFLK